MYAVQTDLKRAVGSYHISLEHDRVLQAIKLDQLLDAFLY